MRKIPIHPKLENCPIITSIKNNGMPHMNNIKRNGTKNAPEKKDQKELTINNNCHKLSPTDIGDNNCECQTNRKLQ